MSGSKSTKTKKLDLPARRTGHVRVDDLEEPEPVPRDTDFASIIESSVSIVEQPARPDPRQSALALLSAIAFPDH